MEEEAEAPAGPSGFLVEIFEPHFTLEPAISVSESDFVWSEKPTTLPASEMTTMLEAKPGFAGAVPLEKSVSAQNSHGNTRAPSLEVREMGRGVSVNTDFPELVSSGLEATSRQMEVSFESYAPPDAPVLWEEAHREFPGFETQLGDLGRLAFVTLGWDEIAKGEGLSGDALRLPAAPPAQKAPEQTASGRIEVEEVSVAEPERIEAEIAGRKLRHRRHRLPVATGRPPDLSANLLRSKKPKRRQKRFPHRWRNHRSLRRIRFLPPSPSRCR